MNSTDHDDAYPTCAETHATLRIYPGDLDPDSVTGRLGIEPSDWQRRGEPRRIGGVSKVAPISGWFLSSEGHIVSRDVRRHLDWLLDRLAAKAPLLRSLHEEGSRIEVCCKWLSMSGHGGPILSPAQMRGLSELGLELWFDIYFVSANDPAS
jgi:hypothetical protein